MIIIVNNRLNKSIEITNEPLLNMESVEVNSPENDVRFIINSVQYSESVVIDIPESGLLTFASVEN